MADQNDDLVQLVANSVDEEAKPRDDQRKNFFGFCFGFAIFCPFDVKPVTIQRIVLHFFQTILLIFASVLIPWSPSCTFLIHLPNVQRMAITVVSDCAFSISFWSNFSQEYSKRYENIGLNGTDLPAGADRIRGQYGILVLTVLFCAATITMLIFEFVGRFFPMIEKAKNHRHYQYTIHFVLGLFQILLAIPEFWMAFGFGFVAQSIIKATTLTAENLEKLLPFLSTLPKWLQELIRKTIQEVFNDFEKKYIGLDFVTYINIAWIVAAVFLLASAILSFLVPLANWTASKAKKII